MPSIIMTHCKQYFEILLYVTFVFIKEKIITIKGLNGVSTNFLLIIILLILIILSIFINI